MGKTPAARVIQAMAHPALALQAGMNVLRKMVWKHMSPTQKARHLLRKVVGRFLE